MAFTATQYLFEPTEFTATTTATVGGYSVPASTRFRIFALTLANTATTNAVTYADVQIFDGTTAYTILQKGLLYPNSNLAVPAAVNHTLPTSGSVYITPYATTVTAMMSGVEIT